MPYDENEIRHVSARWEQQELGRNVAAEARRNLIFAGLAAAGVITGLRTRAGQRFLSRTSKYVRPTQMSGLERDLLHRIRVQRELRETAQRALDDADLAARVTEEHLRHVDEALIERNRPKGLIGRILGLRQVTVGDIVDDPSLFRLTNPEDWMVGKTGVDPDFFINELRSLVEKNASARNMILDRRLFMTKAGDVVDFRRFAEYYHDFVDRFEDIRVPIVNFPAKIFRLGEIREARRRFPFEIFKEGTAQPIFGLDQPFEQAKVLIGDKLYNLADTSKVLDEGLYTMPYGTFPRIYASIFGLASEKRRVDKRGWFKRVLDLGNQGHRSFFDHIKEIATKKRGPFHPESLLQRIQVGADPNAWRLLRSEFLSETDPITEEGFRRIQGAIKGALGDLFPEGRISLRTEKDVARVLQTLAQSTGSKAFGRRVQREYLSMLRNPLDYFHRKRFRGRRLFAFPYDPITVRIDVDKIDDMRALIQQEIFARLHEKSAINLAEGFENIFGRESRQAVRRMILSYHMRSSTPKELQNILHQGSPIGEMLKQETKRLHPWYTVPSIDETSVNKLLRVTGGPVLVRKVSRPESPIRTAREVYEAVKSGVPLREIWTLPGVRKTRKSFSQFTAGRGNMEDFTTISSIPYYTMNRLNELFAFYGLGLSPDKLGSASQIFSNLLVRRYLAAIAGITALGYLNWEFENLTGINVRDELANTAGGISLLYASVTDKLGITRAAKWIEDIAPGSSLFWELPVVSWFDPRMTREEKAEYLREGDTAIRAGRWWQYGSTPIQGGRVRAFVPSWYRRITSDYLFTDDMYGSREEYYKTHWLPTPRFPAAPIRYFASDPYHFEKRTYHTRPYPETGPITIFEDIPLAGPILSATIGRILKPPRRMHEEELDAYLAGMQAGQHAIITRAGHPLTEEDLILASGATGGFSPYTGEAMPQVSVEVTPGGRVRFLQSGSDPPLRMHSVARAVSPEATGKMTQAINQAKSRDKQLALYQVLPTPGAPEPPVDQIISSSDPRLHMADAYEDYTTILGLAGFIIRSAAGYPHGTAMDDKPRFQNTYRAQSIGRFYEDLNLGGFPGELSEVARRFIPNLPWYDDYIEFNPLQNDMPSWMPGPEYMVDYHRGDPYIREMVGEARLPGAGYGKINPEDVKRSVRNAPPEILVAALKGEVSPYEIYDPFTRYKILANVAPWSDQYKAYERMLRENPRLIPQGEEETFKRVKEQARARKERFRTFHYKFVHAKLNYENVTVMRVLDNNTFLTEEYPRNPIRLAGLHAPSGKDSKEAEAARAYLQNRIYPGARLRIGYTADPLKKYSSDTLNTIRAVVYSGRENINRSLINQNLAKERTQEDPASIHARYGSWEIALGSVLERVMHADTPIATKFMQVRSPLEMYERMDLYGQRWQNWSFRDIVIPTVESFAAKSPLHAAALGAIYGYAIGSATRSGGKMAKIGALLLGGLSLIRSTYEKVTGEVWIPSRRRKEWELQEYGDILNYLKYQGLYRHAAQKALEEEGVDVEEFFKEVNRRKWEVRRKRQELQEEKKNLILEDREANKELITEINRELKMLQADRIVIENPSPWFIQAVAWRLRAERTMYGANPYGDRQATLAAVPQKFQDYFTDFVDASPEERERIEKIVPRGVRRFLQAAWREEVDPQIDLEEYFQDHYLPPAHWEGWHPSKDLRDIVVRIARDEGTSETELGFWRSDVRRAELNEAPLLPWQEGDNTAEDVRLKIQAILEGQGLEGVFVMVSASNQPGISVEMDIEQDRSDEIASRMVRLFS